MAAAVVHTRGELDEALSGSGAGVALVPTMGAVHEGHLELVRTARTLGDTVVASVFVNPTQFGPGEDFERYPRTLDRDTELLGAAGVDIVFAPDVETIYPPGSGDITVDPGPLGAILEGTSRPAHFRGVLTVVAKLFALVRPTAATFGEKDYQQLVLIRRMARALHTGTHVVGTPTVRESDGLAKSSRNVYLDAAERTTALELSRALHAGREVSAKGAAAVLSAARAVLDGADGVDLDYLALTDAELGDPVPGEHARLLVAAHVGATRLIDNLGFDLPTEGLRFRTMLKSKIHRATVTQADLHYVGSVTVDADLLDAADILPGELVHIVDIDNGARLETYTIAGERGSGVIGINGAAARLVHTGDLVILIAYAQLTDAETRAYRPNVVFVDEGNAITGFGGDAAEAPQDPALVRGDLPSRLVG